MDISQIEKSAKWSDPREIQTKFGPRIFRKAEVTPEFSAMWRSNKEEVKALGAGFSKNQKGEWELSWWQQISSEVVAARAESIQASHATDAEIDLPKPEGLEYKPFQKAGIRFGLLHKNVLIGDDMGLGKTIQAIGIINTDPEIKTALIICPKSVKRNWLIELNKWLTRSMTVGVAGAQWPNADIVIINFEALAKWDDQISARTWGACIIDEAHLIKSKDARRSILSKAVKSVRKIRMTGTPIVNRPSELWNIIEDLAPEQFGNFWSFVKRYADAQNTGFGWDFSGASNLDELQRRLRETIMVRRLKSEVLKELKPKIRQIIELEADSADQKRAVKREQDYERASEDRLADLRAQVELSKTENREAYLAAVEALKDASAVDFSEMSKLRHETALSKVPAIIAHAKACLEDNDSKLLLFAHHRDVIAQLKEGLAEFNPVILMGGISDQERQNSIETFQKKASCRIFIGSIMAAGVGITLTAASLAIFAELDWVPGNVTQAEDRAHRIGQTETLLIHHLVLAESLDARMAKMLVEKQEVIDNALDTQHPDRIAPVYQPKITAATKSVSVTEIETAAAALTPDQIKEIHFKLRQLAGYDGDFAAELNGAGFNKLDTMIGHSLADQVSLTPKQAALGMKLVTKYRKQVGGLSWENGKK